MHSRISPCLKYVDGHLLAFVIIFAKSNVSAMSYEEQLVTWTIRRKSEVGSTV
ncbi:hypothetical protein BD410DRAFT_792327 [Rickenella mellea]|uniref:Uncharacterized protein n=1 Tax=Rickenella mellea TaxID=50990 RepID=A0A4Y7PVY7_9AGAM|nr:hypothetical protein BD410DRAFT_792327 [Rickenella mellea]